MPKGSNEKTEVLAFKDNDLVQVKGKITKKDSCTETQAKLLTYISSMVKKGDTDKTPYIVKIDDFFNMAKKETGNVSGFQYNHIRQQTLKLKKLAIETTETDTKGKPYFNYISYISQAKYFYEEGFMEIYLPEYFIDLYTKYDNNFTKINVLNAMKLSGKYAVFMYEFLLSWRGATVFKCTTEQLRKALNVPLTKYKKTRHFFQWCVYPALEEINDKTELNIEIVPTKTYRQEIQELEFKLSLKTKKTRPISETEQLLLDNGITPAIAKNLVLNNSKEKIKGNYQYIKNNLAQGKMQKPDNIAGLIVTAIKDDWAHIESEDLFTSQLEKEIKADKEVKAQKQKEFLAEQKRLLEEEKQKEEPYQPQEEFFKQKLQEMNDKKL